MVALATNPTNIASELDGPQRQQLAVAALAGDNVSDLARQNQVSRKFIYQQKEKAQQSLHESFTPSPADEEVLFYLPVTKKWLYGLVLGLLLTCRSSFRGIQQLLADHFGRSLGLDVHFVSPWAVKRPRGTGEADRALFRIVLGGG